MKKILGLIFLFVLTVVSIGYAQKIDTLLEYNQPIAAHSEKSFTINIKGKEYTEIKLVCNVDQRDVVMSYKTDNMSSYDTTSTTRQTVYFNYLYHKRLFLLSATVPVKAASSIDFIIGNRSNKDTSVRLTVYGYR